MVGAALCALTAALLVGWGIGWMVRDARERRWEKEAAERYLAHRASLRADNRRLRSIEGDPE